MRSFVLVALLFCSAELGLSQTKSSSPPISQSYDNEAFIVELSEATFRYNSDGTGERNLHQRVKIQNDAGVRGFSVVSIPYATSTESSQIVNLSVRHSDGSMTGTPATDAMDVTAPVTQQAPLYSDLKIQQIPVRGLRVGDTLEYRVRIQRNSAESPSRFWNAASFLKDNVVLSQSITLDVPSDKYVQVWSPVQKPSITEKDGRRVYVWSSNQLKPTTTKQKSDDDPVQSASDKMPEVEWTTFRNWQEVGEWYRALAAPRTIATDALRAQADEITREARTPEDQVRALYSFVATRIRYVGIDLGVGRYQPHAAAEVLANQYGDCKDKDTLLEALLHAKGFTTAPALIGVNIDLVPELPSPSQFNHVITTVTLPSGKLWMDTTAEIAPFQYLLAPLRNKDALVIPAPDGASTLERTPAKPPFAFANRFEATATLAINGELKGRVEINSRSDEEILLRAIARNLAPAQWDQGSQYLANLLGFSGTTNNSSFGRADDTSTPMRASYDYTRKPFGDWDNFRIIPLFPVHQLPEAPEKQPSADIDLNAERTDTAISRIQLPDNFGADLPDAIHVKAAFATFDKTYKLENGVLIAERTLVVLQSKVPATSWEQYKKFAKDISLGEEAWIQLTSSKASGVGPHPPKPGENNPAAAQLIADATVLEGRSDWAGALKKLDAAQEIQPEQPFLWSNYGFLAMVQRNNEEAKKHYRHELELHPDEGNVIMLYGGLLYAEGEHQEAQKLASAYLERNPSDQEIAIFVAGIRAETSVPDAISTLRRTIAAAHAPGNQQTQAVLAEYLIRNHQPEDAAALVKKELENSDDPTLLNTAAYLLAEAKSDLPLAEQNARKALASMERDTSTASISEANARSFQQTSLLVATWDTLGFILLEENKLEESSDYLAAAWRNLPSRVTGAHYGQLQEALGDLKGALRTYELARSFPDGKVPAVETPLIEASVSRLKKAGVTSTVNGHAVQILQDERTFKIKPKSALASHLSATFRLQMSSQSTAGIMRVGGDSTSDDVTDSIKALTWQQLVPAHSGAKILRDAVLSCPGGQSDCWFVLMPIGRINAER